MQVSDTIDGVAIHLTREEAEDVQNDLCCETSPAGDELFYLINKALGNIRPCASYDQADGSSTAWGSLASPHVRNNDNEDDGN